MRLLIYITIFLFQLCLQSCSDKNILTKSSAIALYDDDLYNSRQAETYTKDNQISFTVIHSKTWEVSEEFTTYLKEYGLTKRKEFSIDDNMAGFHLDLQRVLLDPVDIGKEISLFSDEILLVEVNGVNSELDSPF